MQGVREGSEGPVRGLAGAWEPTGPAPAHTRPLWGGRTARGMSPC